MKAVIWTAYGPPDVLKLGEAESPVPKDNEVLIKIHATAVTAGDCEARCLKFSPYLSVPMRIYVGLWKPKRVTILGQELSGEIEGVGKDVTSFKIGDQVFAGTGLSMGAYAEYICLPAKPTEMEGVLGKKPSNLSFGEAAVVPTGGLEAYHFLRKAGIHAGQRVLIVGSGGSIGTYGVQIAKHFGAEVTAVDSTEKLEMLSAIGADYVIDYTKEDFSRNGEIYDVIFDVVGSDRLRRSLGSLKPGGTCLLANPKLSQTIMQKWISRRSGKNVIAGAANRRPEDLESLKSLIETGKVKPIIDRSYTLEQITEAHRYVESGQKKGNVVVKIG